MGCDIHISIESLRWGKEWWGEASNLWEPRNYVLFGNMAEGVRFFTEKAFPTRGIPEDVSWETLLNFYLRIDDELEGSNWEERTVSRETAVEYAREEGDIRTRAGADYVFHPDYHSASWLTTAEFKQAIENAEADLIRLNTEEDDNYINLLIDAFSEGKIDKGKFQENVKVYLKGHRDTSLTEYRAMLAYMQEIEKVRPCRIVFAFDS